MQSTEDESGRRAKKDSTSITAQGASSPAVSSARIKQTRRSRLTTSCLECRRRKLKCDSLQPCNQCARLNKECSFSSNSVYNPRGRDEHSRSKDLYSKSRDNEGATTGTSARVHIRSRSTELQDDNTPEISPMAAFDATYNDDGHHENLVDSGIVYGKSRLTERLGGLFRPSLAQEVKATITAMDKKCTEEGKVLYPPLEIGLLLTASDFDIWPESIHPPSRLMLGNNADTDPMSYLPNKVVAHRLISEFFTNVNTIACAVHRPTLERDYVSFWHKKSIGSAVPKSVQALCFATMFSGAISMHEKIVELDFGVPKNELVNKLQLGTEYALRAADFMRTTQVITIQALVVYLIPQCRSEISRSHSVLVGAALRLAECLGLHRDGTAIGLDPLEIHIRRLIWHQLCFLDIRTCEVQGPRPGVRKEDYDTLLPLNIDDRDLRPGGPAPESHARWTDATFTLIRFECHEMLRELWFDRVKLQSRSTNLTNVMRKIKEFQEYMAKRYDHLIDDRVPIQNCAKLMKELMMTRYHVMILYPYYGSVTQPMPDRLRHILIESGTRNQEMAVALDTAPEISTWKWYSGAYNQYQTAFLLLTEVFIFPDMKQANRIWRCLDYIYDLDPTLPRDITARNTMMALQRKVAAFQIMKGVRAPPSMLQWSHIGQAPDIKMKGVTKSNKKPSVDQNGTIPSFYNMTQSINVDAILNPFSTNAPNQSGTAQWTRTFGTAPPTISPDLEVEQIDLFKDIDWSEWDKLGLPDLEELPAN